MRIDWLNFTPWASLAGGILIGLAAAVFILMNGRVLGVSGILGGLLPPKAGDAGWRVAFLIGVFSAPLLYRWLAPEGLTPAPRIDASLGLLVLAGMLVGVGTRYGSGCTSGHGVCGIARRSPRSVVATLCFMATGFVVVYVVRHLL